MHFFQRFYGFDHQQSYETVFAFFYVDFQVTHCLFHALLFPATYIYRSADNDIYSELLILVGETIEGYNKANKAKSKLKTKQKKKKTL